MSKIKEAFTMWYEDAMNQEYDTILTKQLRITAPVWVYIVVIAILIMV